MYSNSKQNQEQSKYFVCRLQVYARVLVVTARKLYVSHRMALVCVNCVIKMQALHKHK